MSYRALTVPEAIAARVLSGRRDLPTLGVGPLDAGRPYRLLSPGGEALGIALADPENDRLRLVVRADEPFSVGAPLLAARVAAALEARRGLDLAREGAYRVLHGAGDGLPGFAADVYGPFAVLYVYGRAFVPTGRLLAGALRAALGLDGVVLKVRARGAAHGTVRQELLGAAPPDRLVVSERGVPFEVHLATGLNVGLFTDMRGHRHALPAALAGASRVLNGFCYTGSLSVVLARAGARVTSVDLSSGVLAWARDNFRLSGLDPGEHAFVAEDVGRHLARAAREGARYDAILLDPPASSSARGATFSLGRDLPAWIARAAECLAPGGRLWLATHARELGSLPALALRALPQGAALLAEGGLGGDHPTLPAQPEDRYLQVCLLNVP